MNELLGAKLIYRIEIHDKKTLIEKGFLDSGDESEFINLLAGKTLELNEMIDSKIFTCKEYPDYAIYDIAIKRVVMPEVLTNEFPTFGDICKSALFKTNSGSLREYPLTSIRSSLLKAIGKIKKRLEENCMDEQLRDYLFDNGSM